MVRLQQTRKALGSQAIITVIAAKPHEVLEVLWEKIDDFEKRFSRFIANSELSYVNANAGTNTKISTPMHDILAACQVMQEKTDGLYNPLILPALQRAGYVGCWPHSKQFVTVTDYRQRQTANHFRLTDHTVNLPTDSALDLGGIGKGYLLDQLADWLLQNSITNFWISLGGDIITHGYNQDKRPWEIGIQSADASGLAQTVQNTNGTLLAVCTSGVTKRAGKDWHHIIDPRTSKPAQTSVLTATVAGTSAMRSEVAAKTLVISDGQKVEPYLRVLTCKQAVLQRQPDYKLRSETYNV